MKNLTILLLGLCLIAHSGLFSQSYNEFTCGTEINPEESQSSNSSTQICNNNFSSFLANHADDMVPQGINRTLKIRTNVIFVQNQAGDGNFSVNNPDDMDFWDRVFTDINTRMENLLQESCQCSTNPTHYDNIHIEFVPTYIEVRDDYAWDHNNDPSPNTKNSFNKPYLNYINALAEQTPGYEPGFNAIITTDGPDYLTYAYNNPNNLPLWDLGAVSLYTGNWYSAFPTYNLDHPAMWHAPDLYLWTINGLDHLGGLWWLHTQWVQFTAGGFLHEYGHYFNLTHKYQCPNNVMGAPTRSSFSGCQVRQMYETLMTKNLRKYVICEEVLDYDLVVDTDETWSMNMRVFGDVVIRNGATLTVTCELHMSPGGQIIVERGGRLIVDGGLITGDCNQRWAAIRVEGDVLQGQAFAGRVILRNDAIIEHARDAISMNPYHRPWNNGELQQYYGGLVQAENSTIRNCVRGVEFMRYAQGGVKDQSWFDNVLFENLMEGVTFWQNDGVTFENCTFKNISVRGILPGDSEVIVRDGCHFEAVPIGVDIVTTFPNIFGSDIGDLHTSPNTFLCSNAAVSIQSAGNVEPISIYNNIFTGGNKGIKHNGYGRFNIGNNQFIGQLTAIENYDGGINFNLIHENEIQSAYLGSHAVQSNPGLRYLDNCYAYSSLVDIGISIGDIFPYQGNYNIAAGNCFTKQGAVPEVDNDAGTGQVFYFVKSGTQTNSCKYPTHLHNVTLVPNAQNDNQNAICGPSNLTGGGEEINCNFDQAATIQELLSSHAGLMQAIQVLEGSSLTLSQQDQVLLANYKKCLAHVRSMIGKRYISDYPPGSLVNGKELAIDFFNTPALGFQGRMNAYGIMVEFQEYNRARNQLNNTVSSSLEEQNFLAVQQINLNYLSNIREFALSEPDQNFLYAVGTSPGPLNGYARALYEVLTGNRIEVDIPEFTVERSEQAQTAMERQAHIYSYPNPVQNNQHTLVFDEPLGIQDYSATLLDATGKTLRNWQLNGKNQFVLTLENVPQGIYLLQVFDENGLSAYRTNLVITK